MTAEEISILIDDQGIERFIAELQSRGYYVQQLVEESVLDAALTVKGNVRVVDARGIPPAGMRVIIETVNLPVSVTSGGNTVHVGVMPTRASYELNADGQLSINLVKGATILVSLEGGVTRQITVPNEDFDLISIALAVPDTLTTVAAPYVPAVRRDL